MITEPTEVAKQTYRETIASITLKYLKLIVKDIEAAMTAAGGCDNKETIRGASLIDSVVVTSVIGGVCRATFAESSLERFIDANLEKAVRVTSLAVGHRLGLQDGHSLSDIERAVVNYLDGTQTENTAVN